MQLQARAIRRSCCEQCLNRGDVDVGVATKHRNCGGSHEVLSGGVSAQQLRRFSSIQQRRPGHRSCGCVQSRQECIRRLCGQAALHGCGPEGMQRPGLAIGAGFGPRGIALPQVKHRHRLCFRPRRAVLCGQYTGEQGRRGLQGGDVSGGDAGKHSLHQGRRAGGQQRDGGVKTGRRSWKSSRRLDMWRLCHRCHRLHRVAPVRRVQVGQNNVNIRPAVACVLVISSLSGRLHMRCCRWDCSCDWCRSGLDSCNNGRGTLAPRRRRPPWPRGAGVHSREHLQHSHLGGGGSRLAGGEAGQLLMCPRAHRSNCSLRDTLLARVVGQARHHGTQQRVPTTCHQRGACVGHAR